MIYWLTSLVMQPIAMLGDISLLIYQFIAIPLIVTITAIDGIIVV